jgi:hypothetical protein
LLERAERGADQLELPLVLLECGGQGTELSIRLAQRRPRALDQGRQIPVGGRFGLLSVFAAGGLLGGGGRFAIGGVSDMGGSLGDSLPVGLSSVSILPGAVTPLWRRSCRLRFLVQVTSVVDGSQAGDATRIRRSGFPA